LELPFFLISVLETYIIYSYLPLISSIHIYHLFLQFLYFRLCLFRSIGIVTVIRTQDPLLTLTIRYSCNVITMVFLFLKPLLKGNLVKERYSFPNTFVTSTCFVARKMNSGSVMFLPQLFESMSLWMHVQVERSTQSVSQQFQDLWHFLETFRRYSQSKNFIWMLVL